MARALQLAARGATTTFPNPRVGCVVVQGGEIVGEGWHERAGEPHAEVFALRAAGERTRGADLYVTLEPCSHHGRTPPCSDAVIASGVRRVFAATQDPNPLVAGQGLQKLRAADIEVQTGLLEQQALLLNRGFVSRMRRGRPYLTLKLAASLDGRTAMASGESQWISSEAARADVHRLRAQAGAVLTTSATVLSDDPRLTVRSGFPATEGSGKSVRQPDRIVLDSQARVSAEAKVWSEGARRLWLTAQAPVEVPAGVEHLAIGAGVDGRLNLAAAFDALGKAGVNEALVECGPVLAGALLQAGLVDELVTYLAPTLLGHDARALAHLPNLVMLDHRLRLRYTDVRSIGPDLRITAVPVTQEN